MSFSSLSVGLSSGTRGSTPLPHINELVGLLDLLCALWLVLLPVLSSVGAAANLGARLGQTALELAGFLVAMAVGGRVLLPRLLNLMLN